MSQFNDPDAQAPRPTKKAAPAPVKAAAKKAVTPRVGQFNDPDNPVSGRQGDSYNDDGSFVGSLTMPGYMLHQRDMLGAVISPDEYRTWLYEANADPYFQALAKAYGASFVAFEWFAARTGMDDIVHDNQMNMKFGGWNAVLKGADPGGGGSRGGYSGGGGGASKEQQFAAAEAAIRNKSNTFGMALPDESIKSLARVVVNDNWSNDQLDDYLLADPTQVVNPGTVRDTVEMIKMLAKNQLVTVSDETANGWAKRIMSGEMDQSTIATIFKQQAASEFGWAAEALNSGAMMSDILSPSRDTVARELELNPNDVDLMDERWRKMVQVTGDDGTVRAATLTESTRAARKDGQYAKTAGAARMAAQTATIIRNIFES